jgi:hypothetical protein
MPALEHLLKKKYAIQMETADGTSQHPSLKTQYTLAITDDSASVYAQVQTGRVHMRMLSNLYVLYSLYQKAVLKNHPPSNLEVTCHT